MLSIYQATPAFRDVRANLDRVAATARAARGAGSRLLVLPELFLTGYNLGQAARELAEPADGPMLAELARIAADAELAVVAGFPERAGAQIYNAAVLVDAEGRRRAVYRKAHLFGDREPAVFEAGDRLSLIDLPEGRVGLAICYDIEFAEIARLLTEAGAEIVIVPTANMTPFWDVPTTLVRARALENGVGIVYANLCGTEGDLSYTGLSAAVGPDGRDVVRAGSDGPVLLTVPCAALTDPRKRVSTQAADRRTHRLGVQPPA
jgi:predicted amidohydrolase